MRQLSLATTAAVRTPAFIDLKCVSLLAAALWLAPTHPAAAETIDIAIGHQSMCTDTYTGGIVIKELKLLEKHLPHDGKYAGATYNISWADYASGGPITNQMLANKLNFGVMGDYPLDRQRRQVPGDREPAHALCHRHRLQSEGAGNAIVVPVRSNIYKLEDLKGKAVSTPVGSAVLGHADQGAAGQEDAARRASS